jgi:hypothetical protein
VISLLNSIGNYIDMSNLKTNMEKFNSSYSLVERICMEMNTDEVLPNRFCIERGGREIW